MFFRKTPKPKETTVHTYNHIVGIEPLKLTKDETESLVGLAPIALKILKNKVVVSAAYSYKGTIDEYNIQKGKVLALEELIAFFSNYEDSLKNSSVRPISGTIF